MSTDDSSKKLGLNVIQQSQCEERNEDMIVAIMSDSHDNIWNLRKAVDIVKDSQAGLIIHCGDFIAPFMLKELDDTRTDQ